jgi:hypothetical protein
VALLDYDGDGLLDVFVTGGGYFAGPDKKQIKGHPSRLYRNLGGCKFKDVTREAGLEGPLFYTYGCAVADYDRDGWPDLLVTGWGRLALYHNEPDGRGGRHFVEVTRRAGLTDDLWSTSAGWADLDGDGYPDLYVVHYVDWSFANDPYCSYEGAHSRDGSVPRDVCPPRMFTALPHKVYRNNGDGTFTDVSKEAGLRKDGKGLGVVLVDVDGDGKPDAYVANDTEDNFLYMNRSRPGKIRFEEVGLRSGVARDDRGIANASMGVDAADYDGSGRPSLWCTNYERELHALYRNRCEGGRVLFVYSTQASGIAAIGQSYVGFGTAFVDLDNDGWEDLVVVDGHVMHHPTTTSLRQRPVLLRNLGNRLFGIITDEGGRYFRDVHRGRGLAVGDLDNDGWPDLVVSHMNEPVTVLRNRGAPGRHWFGVELVGRGNRDVVGAKLVLEVGGRRLTRFAKGGGSYLSANDRRILFGLAAADRVDRLTVEWPWGGRQEWAGAALAPDRYWRLREGKDGPEAVPVPVKR